MELESSLIQEREKWSRELERTRDDMREALAAKDKESLEQLRETEAKMDRKIEEIERAREELKVGMQRQYEEQISKLQTALEQQTLDGEDTKKKLQEMEKSLEEMREWAEAEEPQWPAVQQENWKPGDDLDDDFDDEPDDEPDDKPDGEPDSLPAPQNVIEEESYKTSDTGKHTLSISGDRYFFCGPRYQVWYVLFPVNNWIAN
jgi:chromosome segregation ATPase